MAGARRGPRRLGGASVALAFAVTFGAWTAAFGAWAASGAWAATFGAWAALGAPAALGAWAAAFGAWAALGAPAALAAAAPATGGFALVLFVLGGVKVDMGRKDTARLSRTRGPEGSPPRRPVRPMGRRHRDR